MNMKKLLQILLLFSLSLTAYAQDVIKGIIHDDTGQTLPGATIVIKGTSTYAAADINGEFSVKAPKEVPFTLVVNMVGFESQEVDVYEITNDKLTIQLQLDNILNEVVVVGYGE